MEQQLQQQIVTSGKKSGEQSGDSSHSPDGRRNAVALKAQQKKDREAIRNNVRKSVSGVAIFGQPGKGDNSSSRNRGPQTSDGLQQRENSTIPWQTFGKMEQQLKKQVEERQARDQDRKKEKRLLKVEMRQRKVKVTNESSDDKDYFEPKSQGQRATAVFGNRLAEQHESNSQHGELEDRIQVVQDDFESEMKKRFDQQDIRDVQAEFNRRFAVYKHRTQQELERERRIFREMRVRENQLNEMLDARDDEIQQLNMENRKLETILRDTEIKMQESDVHTNDLLLELE